MAFVRDEMVISRAECGEQQSDEDAVIRPTLARIKKRPSSLPTHERDSADADDCERGVRDHIREIRNAEPAALIVELVV